MSKTNQIAKTENAALEARERASRSPATDIFENGEEYLIVADLPGVKEGDLDVRLDDSELTVDGHRPTATSDFHRTFRVPKVIDRDSIRAALTNGVLTVQLPKAAGEKTRTITVTSG